MKESKHTPGPWSVIGMVSGHVQKIVTCDAHGNTAANIATLDIQDSKIKKSNARLIAAAPELLASLERSLERLNAANAARTEKQGRFMVSDIEAAIAKAKGVAP